MPEPDIFKQQPDTEIKETSVPMGAEANFLDKNIKLDIKQHEELLSNTKDLVAKFPKNEEAIQKLMNKILVIP